MTHIRPKLPLSCSLQENKRGGVTMEAMGVSSHWAEHISLHPVLFWLGRGMIDDPGIDRSPNREGNPCFE